MTAQPHQRDDVGGFLEEVPKLPATDGADE